MHAPGNFSLPFGERIAGVVFGGYRVTGLPIRTEAGVDGAGDPLVRLAPKATGALVEELAPILIGQDPRDVEPIWDMRYATMPQRRHTPGTMPDRPGIGVEVTRRPSTATACEG